jgi:tellurite resistance protein TehA-like permease
MAGLWLWGLSIWFFLVSVGSLWKYLRPESKGKLRFQMTWFSFVFPNTALVSFLLFIYYPLLWRVLFAPSGE